jgi:hypothetical protein
VYVPFGVVSQGFLYGLWNVRAPVLYPWLLVKSTEGTLGGITGMRQKQGNTEAAPVGRREIGVTLGPVSIIT